MGENMDTAKIFKNGHSQAVRLPKSCRFDDQEVYIKKINNMVIIIPKDKIWEVMKEGIDKFTDDYMTTRNQPEIDNRKSL